MGMFDFVRSEVPLPAPLWLSHVQNAGPESGPSMHIYRSGLKGTEMQAWRFIQEWLARAG